MTRGNYQDTNERGGAQEVNDSQERSFLRVRPTPERTDFHLLRVLNSLRVS